MPRRPERSEPALPVVGIDIGGTKCAVSSWSGAGPVIEHVRFSTGSAAATIDRLLAELHALPVRPPFAIGIACGGPLDSRTGTILSPPNLPGWDRIRIVQRLRREFGGPVSLMNDANATALAEWRFGAGRGTQSMVFLTAGTGMGSGLILNGRLYEGASGDAGEVGHLRLAPSGPRGYGKRGSFEGFCSGGGIPDLVRFLPILKTSARRRAWKRAHPSLAAIAEAARQKDPVAVAVMNEVGTRLGAALAGIIDVLNPERIVIGSLYVRCRALIETPMRRELGREALARAARACRIVPASLGEASGNYGAICVALEERERGGGAG